MQTRPKMEQQVERGHTRVCQRQTCWWLYWLVNSLDVAPQLERRHAVAETLGTHGTLPWQRLVGHVLLHVTHQPESKCRAMFREGFITPVMLQPASRCTCAAGSAASTTTVETCNRRVHAAVARVTHMMLLYSVCRQWMQLYCLVDVVCADRRPVKGAWGVEP